MPGPAAHLARRWAVAAATLGGAVAVLLVVSSSRPPSVGVSETHPPPVRSASLLRRAGGVLWWVTGDCRLYRDAMAGQTLDRAPGRFCRAWPSPDGAVVLAAPGEGRTMPPPGRLEALDGRSLHVAAVTGLPADLVAGPVAWSPDSLLAASCLTGPEGPHIALMAAPWSRANAVAGRCSPAFTQVVTMLTTDGTRVFENGFDLHLSGRLARAVDAAPGGYRVTAITALPYGLAVAVHAVCGRDRRPTPRHHPGGGDAGRSLRARRPIGRHSHLVQGRRSRPVPPPAAAAAASSRPAARRQRLRLLPGRTLRGGRARRAGGGRRHPQRREGRDPGGWRPVAGVDAMTVVASGGRLRRAPVGLPP
jgi:hypothetical protein